MISRIDIEDMTDAQDEAPERIWADRSPFGEHSWMDVEYDGGTLYVRADLARPSQELDEAIALIRANTNPRHAPWMGSEFSCSVIPDDMCAAVATILNAAVSGDLARPSQAGDERVVRLVWAAKAVADGSLDTFRARNGKLMGIEADDGEKCEIVHSDLMHWLRAALAAMDTPKGGGDE